jgi:hypothetical protein
MLNSRFLPAQQAGLARPTLGSRALVLGVVAFGVLATACGENERTRILPPAQVAMNPAVTPVFETDEMSIFEVKQGLAFPIIAPEGALPGAMAGQHEPYGREPWIRLEDVRVQLTWTISNLDDEPRVVELLIDPWTEFGRYWPGLTLVDAEDGEYQPNLSGIDRYYLLEKASAGEKSRVHGTYTYDDMDELARDFATAMNLIKFPPEGYPGGGAVEEEDRATLLATYVNHAFDFQNHSHKDPLVKAWVPQTVAGLTGVDFGLRTYEPCTIALEVVLEVTDQGTGKVREEGADDALLAPTEEIITIGTAGPAT